uniref:DUF6577 family protein n=1 Tax=Agathobacter sp. TaxID=2021311 RepID=UPI0040569A66
MIERRYFEGVSGATQFTRKELLESFRMAGYMLSDASFYKRVEELVKGGQIIRVGRNAYSLPDDKRLLYEYKYSELAEEVAQEILEEYPYVNFSIFEFVQLNDFVNHLIAHNVIFLSVDAEVMEFIFESLKEKYPGKVLINPNAEIYHQYWSDNMIVILKLTTEAPKGQKIPWHTRLEKLLVDIVAEPLLLETISQGEYPQIYTDAFERYIIDESGLFRYARRRRAANKIKKLIREETGIVLRTKE